MVWDPTPTGHQLRFRDQTKWTAVYWPDRFRSRSRKGEVEISSHKMPKSLLRGLMLLYKLIKALKSRQYVV